MTQPDWQDMDLEENAEFKKFFEEKKDELKEKYYGYLKESAENKIAQEEVENFWDWCNSQFSETVEEPDKEETTEDEETKKTEDAEEETKEQDATEEETKKEEEIATE